MPDVKMVDVTKTFEGGRIVAVDHVSLHVRDGEYFCILGPSGCGKTTLLRLIAGILEPDEGEIYIGGRPMRGVPPEDRDIGFVFQTFALFPHMTAWENVTYGPRVRGWPEDQIERVGREMLELVGLYERADAYPKELSGGMMQRVGLARALATGASLLLLDEPLSSLDAKISFELRYEIRRLVKALGRTAIHVTHDQAEAMAIADRIAVMKKGRILQVGTPQELYMRPKHIFVAHFIGEANFLEGFVEAVGQGESTVRLRGDLVLKVARTGLPRGQKVVVGVRPEVLSLRPAGGPADNALPGSVERVMFEGIITRYEVRLESDDLLVVTVPSMMARPFGPGDKVLVEVPRGKVFLFPYPERGLKEELSVE